MSRHFGLTHVRPYQVQRTSALPLRAARAAIWTTLFAAVWGMAFWGLMLLVRVMTVAHR